MHFRIATYKGKPGTRDDLVAKAESLRHKMEKLEGLVFIRVVETGTDSYATIAAYESQAAAEASSETAQAIYAELADVIDMSTFKMEDGPVIWEV